MGHMDIRPLKKVSSACSYCKYRKRKCSATMPCKNCVDNNIRCVSGEAIDGRRRESFQRARIDSAFHKSLLRSLLERLQQGNDHDLTALINTHASLESLASYLEVAVPSPGHGKDVAVHQVGDKGTKAEESDDGLGNVPRCLQTLSTGRRISLPVAIGVDFWKSPLLSTAKSNTKPGTQLQKPQVSNSRLPLYMIQPVNIPVDNHLSVTALFTNFRDNCRRAISSGSSEEVVLGPRELNLDTALKGCWAEGSFTPSMWICRLQQIYGDMDVYVRLMCIYFVNQYLRWTISPTAENYELLPICMRPTLSQYFIPHYAAIDLCHLPALRDLLVRQQYAHGAETGDREDILAFQLAGLRTAWNGSWEDTVVLDARLGFHTLTQNFIETAGKVEEWIAGRIVLEKFPELAGEMQFAEEKTIPIDARRLDEMAQDFH